MPAKPLTPEQKADAERLRLRYAAFAERRKDAGESWTQEKLAAELGMGQSALNQYIKGDIPLNGRALVKFCELLNCSPSEISPNVVAEERAWARRWVELTGPLTDVKGGEMNGWPLSPELLAALRGASEEQREILEGQARMLLRMKAKPLSPEETAEAAA